MQREQATGSSAGGGGGGTGGGEGGGRKVGDRKAMGVGGASLKKKHSNELVSCGLDIHATGGAKKPYFL